MGRCGLPPAYEGSRWRQFFVYRDGDEEEDLHPCVVGGDGTVSDENKQHVAPGGCGRTEHEGTCEFGKIEVLDEET